MNRYPYQVVLNESGNCNTAWKNWLKFQWTKDIRFSTWQEEFWCMGLNLCLAPDKTFVIISTEEEELIWSEFCLIWS